MTNFSLLWLVAILILAGCDSGDVTREISEVREIARERPPSSRPPTSAERFGLRSRERSGPGGGGHAAGGHAAGGHGAQPSGLAWELPQTWEQGPKKRMREASFLVKGKPEVDCYIARAGGGMRMNVDRWRRQMGLEPTTAEEVEGLPRTKLLGRDATVIDLEGDFAGMGGATGKAGYRMLGLILIVGQTGLFVKMTGPAAAVESERENFAAFVASIRSNAEGAGTTSHSAPSGGTPAGGALSWMAPDGWEKQPDRQMRAVTYRPGGDATSQCYVSIWPGNVGGLLANINRWRREAGAQPVTLAQIEALPKTKALGRDVPLLHVEGDFRGMGGAPLSGAGLLAIYCELRDRTVTVKMTGPAALITKEKDNFIAFCESLKADG